MQMNSNEGAMTRIATAESGCPVTRATNGASMSSSTVNSSPISPKATPESRDILSASLPRPRSLLAATRRLMATGRPLVLNMNSMA